MAPTRYIAAGTQLAFGGLLDTYGFFAGQSGSVATGATGEAMWRWLGIKSANPGPVEPEAVNITGDDTVLGAIDFGPNEVPKWICELGAFDLTIQALMQGTSVETLPSGVKIGVLQPNDPIYPDVCLIYQGKTKYKDVGQDGVKAWSGYIVPLCSCVPLGRAAFSEREAASDRYKVTAQVASRKPWGVTISEALLGTSGAPLLPFTSDNPIVLERHTGNGVLSTFNLTYTPISAAKTVVWVETAAYTPSSVSAASKTFTLSSPPANNARIITMYEFTP